MHLTRFITFCCYSLVIFTLTPTRLQARVAPSEAIVTANLVNHTESEGDQDSTKNDPPPKKEPSNQKNFGTKYFEEFKIDLVTGRITPSTLPFDVPFVLKGKADIYTDKVTIYLYEVKNRAKRNKITKNTKKRIGNYQYDCEECIKKIDSGKHTGDTAKEQVLVFYKNQEYHCDINDCTIKEEPIGQWSRNFYTGASDSFFVYIPPLDPSNLYEFRFEFERRVNPQEQEALTKFVRVSLAKQLNELKADSTDNIYTQLATKSGELRKSLQGQINQYLYSKNLKLSDETTLIDNNETFKDYLKDSDFALSDGNLDDAFKGYQNSAINLKNFYSKTQLAIDSILTDTSASAKAIKEKLEPKFSPFQKIDEKDLKLISEGRKTINSNSKPVLPLIDSAKTKEQIQLFINNLEEDSNTLESLKKQLLQIVKATNDSTIYKAKLNRIAGKLSKTIDRVAAVKAAVEYIQAKRDEKAAILENIDLQLLISAATENIHIQGTNIADFKTRAESYIIPDVGVAYVNFLSGDRYEHDIIPYYGINFHLSPLNRESKYKLSFRSKFHRSLSGVIGLSMNSIEENTKDVTRKDLLNNAALITGIGLRISDFNRLTLGTVWYQKEDPNPFVSRQYLRTGFFAALSLDLDLKFIVDRIDKKLFQPKQTVTNAVDPN